MPPVTRLLILGGTTEARALAAACAAALPHLATISSLAGRTTEPIVPEGSLRIGGFGGVPGLVSYLRTEHVAAIIDATHPFADRMTRHAAEAASVTGIPVLRLQRPGWTEQPGDHWHRVPTMTEAAAAVHGRVFLTTGRQEIAAFADRDDCWFLARSVEPPQPPMPGRLEVILDRGPFTVDGETALLADHRIDVLVTKDSGGADAKLAAARARNVPVVVVDRPPMPDVPTVPTVQAALEWITSLS